MIKYLSYDEIVALNHKILTKYGGQNIAEPLNQQSLIYLVDIVQNDLYFPTLFEKTAKYLCDIVTKHIFMDANKRTGFYAAVYFLELNNCQLIKIKDDDDTVDFVLRIAKNEIDIEQTTEWLKERVQCQ